MSNRGLEVLRNPSKGPYATLTAAGTTQATAAEMTADMVMVTSASEDAGVIIPTLNARDECIVCNGTNVTILVYPRTGGQINNSTANLPVIVSAFTAVRFRGIDGAGKVMAFV